jgi:hypothetical protein
MGTPEYMPPEQARGEPVDERADVYALGAILYHLLAGQPPYRGADSAAVLEHVLGGPPPPLSPALVPPDLKAIVDKAMTRDPAGRYPAARELAEDLRRFQTGRLVRAHEYSLMTLLYRWVVRNRAVVAVAAVALVSLAVMGAAAISRIVRERDRAAQAQARAERERLRSCGARRARRR